MGLQIIFFDYANMAAPRDTIFGMYAHKTARNDIRYIHLLSVFIRGHQGSHVNINSNCSPVAANDD